MTILSAKGIHRSYGTREVLRGVDFAMDADARVGFVGRNGSGKSTLAKILAGIESADEGEVIRRQGLRIAYFAQEPSFESTSPLDAAMEGLVEWRAAMAEHEAATQILVSGEGDMDAALARQADAAARVEARGGWDKAHQAEAMLGHVGIHRLDASLDAMSGGERRRVALARCLLADPELAIMDEPTNHLDLDTVAWLERWLVERFRGALILVTHDRYLLDRVVTRTVEMNQGQAHSYEGGWGDYLEAKALREAHEDRVESNRRNFLRSELEWLRRNPKARTTKQKARVQRAEAALETRAPRREGTAAIEVGETRAGRSLLEAEELRVEVPGRVLVENFTATLRTGERFGILGPNGCGKTSLLRVLTELDAAAAGTVRVGKNTKVAYLEQTRSGLDDTASIFDNVAGDGGHVRLGDQELSVAAYLERFLFSRHEQRKKVADLSGGERARVALAKTLRSEANLVVLDEPTNDLDVDTLAALEQALLDFGGGVLVVTHDRWFLDRVATHLLVFEDSHVQLEVGNYADWAERKAAREASARELAAAAPTPEPKPKGKSKAEAKSDGKLTYAERIELEGLLEKVDAAETRVGELEAELASESFYALEREAQAERFAALETAKAEAEALALRWAELEEKAGG